MIQLCLSVLLFRFLIPSASRQITPTARDRVDMRPRGHLYPRGGNPITRPSTPRLPDGKIGSLPFLELCQGGGQGGTIQGKEGI